MKSIDTDKLLRQMADTTRKAAELTVDSAIGQHVAALIVRDGEISIAALLQSLQHSIENSASARDGKDPGHDIRRQQAEAALRHVRSLLSPDGD